MAGGRLDDKVAIVTGGTSGIGAAIVRRFAEEGALQVVVGTPTDEEARRAEAARLGEGRAVFVGVDVTEPGAAARIVRAAMAAYGRLDALVNNAGVDYSGVHVLGSDLDVSRRVFEVNFFAPLALLQEAARAMVAGRPGGEATGAVVNVASRAALVGIRGMAVYGASKAALVSLTRSAALELAPQVRVNAVAPGMTEGPMMQAWIEGQPDPGAFARELLASIPQGRMATPEEIAAAVLFMVSDEAQHITGAVLPVDGGYTAA